MDSPVFSEDLILKKIKKLKNLKYIEVNGPKTEEEYRVMAIDSLTKEQIKETEKAKPLAVDVETLFTSKIEIKVAKELLEKYTTDYTIESVSDKNTLREIIYLEVIQRRLQEKLNDYYEKNEKALPLQLIDTIHKNSKAIIELKDTLGLNKAKDSKNKYDELAHLKKRYKKWGEENQGSRTATCPHCSKLILFKIRTEAWELQKHPFFQDRIVANKHLIRMYQEGRITKDDVALVLEVSPNYVDWVINKLKIRPINNQTQQETPISDKT